MRDLFNQDRPLSPALIRAGTGLLGVLLGIAGLIILLLGLGNVLSGVFSLSVSRIITGVVQIAGGVGLALALYLFVRLLGEAVMALHRLNDRLGIIGEDVRLQSAAPQDLTPAAKPKPRKVRAGTKPASTPAKEKGTSPDPQAVEEA